MDRSRDLDPGNRLRQRVVKARPQQFLLSLLHSFCRDFGKEFVWGLLQSSWNVTITYSISMYCIRQQHLPSIISSIIGLFLYSFVCLFGHGFVRVATIKLRVDLIIHCLQMNGEIFNSNSNNQFAAFSL